jgi:peptide/nickel transport system substrate-binding protein
MKVPAWRSHFRDAELTALSQAAAKERDSAKRIAMYLEIQKKYEARAPFVHVLAKNAVTALRAGVTGLHDGPLPDYTVYRTLTKA